MAEVENPTVAGQARGKVYRHVVMLKFTEEASSEQIAEVEASFGQLKQQINTIVGYERGVDVSPENLAKGFTHCFLVTFESQTDLKAYLPHPAHEAFVQKLMPLLADVLVFDYWAES